MEEKTHRKNVMTVEQKLLEMEMIINEKRNKNTGDRRKI